MTTEQQCRSCERPVRDNRTICQRCETQTAYNLGDQTAHCVELETVLAKQIRYQPQGDGGRAADPNLAWSQIGELPVEYATVEATRSVAVGTQFVNVSEATPAPVDFHRAAADTLHAQRTLLAAWCRLLWEEREIPLPAEDVRAMSLHLARWLPVLAKHEAGGEFVSEVRALVARIFRVVDAPVTRTKVTVGPCPNDIEYQPCPGQVVAWFPADEAIRPSMTCGSCGGTWFTEVWHSTAAKINQRKEHAA